MEKSQREKYLHNLQKKICETFETLETGSKRFEYTSWVHGSGGGGTMAVLRGDVFERAAVNVSAVYGNAFPGADGSGPFYACGLSMITHMKNPHAPTVHMNIRCIETQNEVWQGGGYDLTPMGFFYDEDTEHFHNTARSILAPFGTYERFFQQAKEYFYVPHRKKERGVGGIFFDHEPLNDPMWTAVGESLFDAIMPIYRRRIGMPVSEEQRQIQLKARATYVEFNLLYDRGTKFGFLSGGNPDAILCSMPPLVRWE